METKLLDKFIVLLKIIGNKLRTTYNAGLQRRRAKMAGRPWSDCSGIGGPILLDYTKNQITI